MVGPETRLHLLPSLHVQVALRGNSQLLLHLLTHLQFVLPLGILQLMANLLPKFNLLPLHLLL